MRYNMNQIYVKFAIVPNATTQLHAESPTEAIRPSISCTLHKDMFSDDFGSYFFEWILIQLAVKQFLIATSDHFALVAHCAKLNMNKKTEQVPIQLPNIARTLSDAKKIIKKKFFPWTSEIIQFVRFENHMDRPDS